MIKCLLLAFAIFLFPSLAMAQCNGIFAANTICGNATGSPSTPKQTAPSAFQGSAGGTNGQIQYNNSGSLAGFTMAGDCTEAIPNITCTKTNGVPFAPSATIDTTNASNLTSGTVSVNRFNSGTNANSGTWLSGAGTWTTPQPLQVTNVLVNGLVADLQTAGDGVCNGTTTFTSASANFSSNDVGKTISINQCTSTSDTLVTTIASVTNSTTIILSVASGRSASGLTFAWGTDNTTALNTLISAKTNGATLYFPAGHYGFAGKINITNFSITLLGAGPQAPSSAFFQNGVTTLTYIGGIGTGAFIDIQSAQYTTITEMMLQSTGQSWTGYIAFVRNSGSGDPAHTKFDHLVISMSGNANGLLLDTSIEDVINDVSFNGGEIGIKGLTSGLTSSYVNVLRMTGGQFQSIGLTPILNGGDLWIFNNVTFEQRRDGLMVVYQGTSGIPATNISFTNCYMDDATTNGSTLIDFYGNGFNFQNNGVTGGGNLDTAINLHATKGFNITGNIFQSLDFGVNYVAATVDGGILSGNAYHGVTSLEGTTANKGTNVVNTGNVAF